jgi:hypothetical protein
MNRRIWIAAALAIVAATPIVLLSVDRNATAPVEIATAPAEAAGTKSAPAKVTLPAGTSAGQCTPS